MFQSDLPPVMKYFRGEYAAVLNSEDHHNPDLALNTAKAKGGTMVLWKKDLDPYITVQISDSPAFLPVVLEIPGFRTTIHIAAYLPTAGKEAEYLAELARMRITIEDLQSRFPSACFFLRGDCNSSKTNTNRNLLFSNFCAELNLARVNLNHRTYHHFLGQGSSDSELDVLLFSNQPGINEELISIECKLENPLVDSHHDLLLSHFTVPQLLTTPPDKSKNVVSPKIENTRHKIIWTEEGAREYEHIVSCHLPRIREQWLDTSSETSMSILLETTNMILAQAALQVNKSVSLSSKTSPKSSTIPAYIRRSNRSVAKAARQLKIQSQNPNIFPEVLEETRSKYRNKKSEHRKIVRRRRMLENIKRDTRLTSVLSDCPTTASKLFQAIRSLSKSSTPDVKKLFVRDRVYEGNEVCDGFYDSIAFLKTEAHQNLESSHHFSSANEDYETILKICRHGTKVPNISLEKTRKILSSIRPAVNDCFSITGYHYRYAGESGLLHLHLLLNSLIDDLNNTSVDELNTVWACILHKGHGKDRSQDSSYRTISTCPFLSKCIDTHIYDTYGHIWEEHQAETQFQGKGSSHELAALLLTETIQHSLNTAKKPAFVLYLDAKSAFDLVVRQFLINNLYHYGIKDQGLLLIDQRLKNRKTICEWNGQLMGPIEDKWGVEQGGRNSSDLYKVYNNEQLETAQESQLGVDLGGADLLVVSAIGQADDVALVSNDIFALQNLLQLSLLYCRKHHVTLRADKTKLQAFSNKSSFTQAYYAKVISPVMINEEPINFVDEAEHVGITRSTAGNLPHILNRFTARRRALAAVLPVGLARGHRGNPAAGIRVHHLYATPVLLSGLASLVLKKTEIAMVDQHMKITMQSLQKLMDKTPPCIVAFLGGVLPGTAQLHVRQLTLFGMITRMKETLLQTHATNILSTASPSAASWFQQIRELCILYRLPHPLDLLSDPPTKSRFNSLVKSSITDYWEVLLRSKVALLTSTPYFRADFMSLSSPHPIWTSCGSNPFECHKAVIAARMLSGRYLTDKLQRHWTDNKAGNCILPACLPSLSEGSLEHLLLHCQALNHTRTKLLALCSRVSLENGTISSILHQVFLSGDQQVIMHFLLDCSTMPMVIRVTQVFGHAIRDRLLYLGRTWCYGIHRERMNQLGLLKFR